MKLTILITLSIIIFLTSLAPKRTYKRYIDKWKLTAQMYQATHGIPASVQLAQALLESGGGQSYIAQNSRNHFGIRWYAGTTKYKAFYDRKGAAWRCYPTAALSWMDHADFMCEHYSTAMGKDWRWWVKHCRGYGGKDYWRHIEKYIIQYKLYQYD